MLSEGTFAMIAIPIGLLLFLHSHLRRSERGDFLVRNFAPEPFQPLWPHILAFGWVMGFAMLVLTDRIFSPSALDILLSMGAGCLCIILGEYLLHRLRWRRGSLREDLAVMSISKIVFRSMYRQGRTIDVTAIHGKLSPPKSPVDNGEKR